MNANGMVAVRSSHSVEETVASLQRIFAAKGLTLFSLIDHSGEAAKVGMKMLPTKLLIFGDPKTGTSIILAPPSSALDLPLKILVYEDHEEMVHLVYNDPAYLQQRHEIPDILVAKLAGISALVAQASE